MKLKRWLTLLTLLVVLLFAAYLWYRPLLSIGGGYAAKHACSCHFLQGRELGEISEHDLNFSVLGLYGLTVEDNTVRSSLFGLVEREAEFLGQRGCVLVNDPTEALPASAPLRKVGGDAGAVYSAPAVTGEAIDPDFDEAISYGMEPYEGGGARGIVILKEGKLVGERYAEGYDQDTRMLGWSMTKTVTGLLAGQIVGGDLPRSAPTPGDSIGGSATRVSATAGSAATISQRFNGFADRGNLFSELWTDRRAEISLADLLRMNSGLAWNEAYGGMTDATVMLHERPDFADFALRSQLIAEPGTEWNYSSGTTNVITEYLSRAVGGQRLALRDDRLPLCTRDRALPTTRARPERPPRRQ